MVFDALFKLFIRFQIAVFRWTNGRAMSAMRGMPILLLTTVGRKTGKSRTTPLMYIRDGDNYVIIASNNGKSRHPAWFHNLQATPQAEIQLPGQRMDVSVTLATPMERDRLWSQLVSRAPFFDGYQRKSSRLIPMVLLKPRQAGRRSAA